MAKIKTSMMGKHNQAKKKKPQDVGVLITI